MGHMEKMGYGDFKARFLAELEGFYGGDAKVNIREVLRNNGQGYDGLEIILGGMGYAAPVIDIRGMYEGYCAGTIDMDGCVEVACQAAEIFGGAEDIRQFAEKTRDWGSVKGDVYPILLNTGQNRGMLQDMPSMQMLDLSVAYIIRGMEFHGMACQIKVTRELLGHYGISGGELHRQAMGNLRKDEYRFLDIADMVGSILGMGKEEMLPIKQLGKVDMHVLTNSAGRYGAAGILDKKLVGDFAGGRDFYILPSSIHEVIFVPVSGGVEKAGLDRMVAEINEAEVPIVERLSGHAYYYDAKSGEIRM